MFKVSHCAMVIFLELESAPLRGAVLRKFPLALVMIVVAQVQTLSQSAPEFVKDDLGIQIEKLSVDDIDEDRYTRDNVIYKVNREFVFDYYILKEGKIFKMAAPLNTKPGDDFLRSWSFVDDDAKAPCKIERISFKVESGVVNDSQTNIKYVYYLDEEGKKECPYYSHSGIVENKMNVWAHPHRDKYFMILELNPFPYIQQPIKIGTKWNWSLQIGGLWGDVRWKQWNGTINNKYEYEITGKETIELKIGKLDCWVVSSIAKSAIGQTKLVAYFNETHGFVKFDYTNIDSTHLLMEVFEIRN